ncbi:hypothetical protein YTPLAS18_08470 [Nitrospira sp.]|nr:hypothetical protein YTPLAS18_08470 [Nitrospira sp.]
MTASGTDTLDNTAPEAPRAVLSFRAMVRDESRNHVLEEGEHLSVEVDVHNGGPDRAENVEVFLAGTPGLVDQFSAPLRIGELPAGEQRRVMVSGTVPKLDSVEQAEITLTVRASGGHVALPTPKKFLMAVQILGEDVEVLSVGVDQVPARVQGFEQADAIGISIGIGTFRDPLLASGRYAARDATVMAAYLKQAVGIPGTQIRVLTDGQALRDDLIGLFETWMPEHVKPRGTVYVYVSGRAVVEPETGAVSLIPYDGKPGSQQRAYGLARLHAALARLPIGRAIVMLDLSLEPTGGMLGALPTPRWDPEEAIVPKGKIVQVIGNTAIQDAHEYSAGQHGLFTYFLLKGLGGAADTKKSGRVLLRELCGYVQTKVQQAAQVEFGNGQTPVCRPTPAGILELERAPIARVR